MEQNITVERALELILSSAAPVDTEQIPAAQAVGRVLAEDFYSPIDQPPWPRSPLDGYAFRAADSAGASKERPVTLPVEAFICAGEHCDREVSPGHAARIMTGAPIPAGCDCVLMQEKTDRGERSVKLYQEMRPFENYIFAGEDFKTGDLLVPAGTRLTGAAIGAVASCGMFREDVILTVFKPLRCALFCTGDELVPQSAHPLPMGKIYSSIAPMISSRLMELGAVVTQIHGEVGDDPAVLADMIRQAAHTNDLIITTGGVSVGAKDILHETLPLLGAERIFWQVGLKPGSPMMFSLYNGTPILSLSGNPFAAGATFELFARPLMAKLSGCDDILPQTVSAILDTPFKKYGKGRRFVRGIYKNGHVTLPEGHSSGQLASAVGTNCLAEIPPSDRPFEPGDSVKVYLI